MLPSTIQSADDLVTSHAIIRDGFRQQALTKTQRATPYVEEARHLLDLLELAPTYNAILDSPALKPSLLAAAGLSDKARGHLNELELNSLLSDVLRDIAERAGENWREELVYRFLLTRGDTLGGSMRNIAGALGNSTLAGAIQNALREAGVEPQLIFARKSQTKIVSIAWANRHLIFDRKPRFIDKSVDAILLNAGSITVKAVVDIEDKQAFLACGELKGGIDPAGADEHWKTARSAFNRIRDSFIRGGLTPPALFFVAAAIERAMALEIYADLTSGELSYAANLTKPEQLADLARWLIRL